MSEADQKQLDAVAAAYRTINEADPRTKTEVARLRKLHKRTGEDPERSELTISEILSGGPGAADRLAATADAVARLWNLSED